MWDVEIWFDLPSLEGRLEGGLTQVCPVLNWISECIASLHSNMVFFYCKLECFSKIIAWDLIGEGWILILVQVHVSK